MEALLTLDGIISLLTLTVLEVVLGIDNIIFISIFSAKLPVHQQQKARFIGLSFALILRVLMLLSITWIIGMKEPLFSFMETDVSIRDLILFAGGIFLMAKSTTEMHHKLEGAEDDENQKAPKSLSFVIVQIALIDVVFSFDSILTAIGLAKEVLIMILAVIVAMIVMLLFSKAVSDYVNKHPTIKMLALSFLLMIGVMLVLESVHVEIPKGYVYFAMAFSFVVELLNMRIRKKSEPVKLKDSEIKEEENPIN